MPTVLRIGNFRFYFYSNEAGEPPHIHIQSDNKTAKFWLEPAALSKSTRFTPKELKKLQKLVEDNRVLLLEAWYEYFDPS